jgi:hypothetical protein
MTHEGGAHALRSSTGYFLRSLREIGRAVRDGAHELRAAAREDRSVVRSSCAALEQLARRSIRIIADFRSEAVARWQDVPFAGLVVALFATTVSRLVAGVLSLFATSMVVCDILLNTARTERVG